MAKRKVKVVTGKMFSGAKVMMQTSAGGRRQLRMAPRGFTYNNAARITEVDRQGKKPLTLMSGPELRRLEFTHIVAGMDWHENKTAETKWFRDVAAKGYRLKLSGLSGFEVGIWWAVEDLDIVVKQRTPGNAVSRAELTWKLIEHVETSVSAGKATKAKTSKAKKKKKSAKKPVARTHRVKKGDTLGKIAQKYLGRSNRYPEIVKLNKSKIKNPNRLSVGWVLKIPKR